MTDTMTHTTGTRAEWLTARRELLLAEKELTRRGDEIAQQRQALPWVRIDKPYRLDTDAGEASLADLFQGRSQLLVYHFMFGPDWAAGCPSCSSIADGFNGIAVHLKNHDVMLWAVSRAPLAKLRAFKQRMGWTFPWASSFASDFNADFNVFFTEEQQRDGAIDYNYRREPKREWPTRASRRQRRPGGEIRRHGGHRYGELHARSAGPQRVRARGRRDLPHLLGLCARRRRDLGHVPLVRPRAQGPQRGRRVAASSRQVRRALSASRGSIAMAAVQHESAGGCPGSTRARPRSAADWLGLAAAPTFAIMALLTGLFGAAPDALCAAMQGTSPLTGMVPMYLLMSAFHAAPWVRLVSGRLAR